MGSIAMLTRGPRVTNAKLKKLEVGVGRRLPEGYRNFMLRYNGGVPKDGFFIFERKRGRWEWSWVDDFRPIATEAREALNLETAMADYVGRIPGDALPIGHAAGGQVILLFVRGERRGQIWLKDEDAAVGDDPDEATYCLARSFAEFVRSLGPDPGEDALRSPKPPGRGGQRTKT
jgi:hypothetical protein